MQGHSKLDRVLDRRASWIRGAFVLLILAFGTAWTGEIDADERLSTDNAGVANDPANTAPNEPAERQFDDDRAALAYAYGLDRARGLLRRFEYFESLGIELDEELAKQGFMDAFAEPGERGERNGAAQMTAEEIRTLLYAFDREIVAVEQRRAREA